MKSDILVKQQLKFAKIEFMHPITLIFLCYFF